MITIMAEQEHYCLVTDGESWSVIERRAGKYYPLGAARGPVLLSTTQRPRHSFATVGVTPSRLHIVGWRM